MPVLHTRGARVSYTRVGIGEPVLLIQGVGAVGKASIDATWSAIRWAG